MNEYMRSHPEAEVFDNRKIKISFFSDWEPYYKYFEFKNYLDDYDDVHKGIDVARTVRHTSLNGHINADCVLVPKEQNTISYLAFDDILFKGMLSMVEGCANLFPKLKKVYTGYSPESDEYKKLTEEFHKYIPDCIVE